EPLGRLTEHNDTPNGARGQQVGEVAGTPLLLISDARYDLAGTTISEMRQRLLNYLDHTGPTPAKSPAYPDAWWDVLASSPETPVAASGQPVNPPGRFRCNPYPAKPLDSRKAAQAAPALLGNCTQFVVEYAGDYLSQNQKNPTPPF